MRNVFKMHARTLAVSCTLCSANTVAGMCLLPWAPDVRPSGCERAATAHRPHIAWPQRSRLFHGKKCRGVHAAPRTAAEPSWVVSGFGVASKADLTAVHCCAGAFPLWLAPVQVALLLVAETEALRAYADSVVAQLQAAGVRVEVKSGGPPAATMSFACRTHAGASYCVPAAKPNPCRSCSCWTPHCRRQVRLTCLVLVAPC